VSAPPESFLEQYRARWNAVGHHDPLSAGMHAGSEMARGATLRAVSLALANLAAGERVRVGFRPGASYANLQTRRLNVDGNLLEEATADPGKIEPLLAHAIHEGAHIRFTRFVELSDRERKKDGRLLHWIHNIIEDERIEPGIARIYPPLSSALQAERQATREGVPAQWGALEVLFALIRRPDTLPQDAWEEHEKILSAAVSVSLVPDEAIEESLPAPAARQGLSGYMRLLLLAIIGGLILNIMPCVLPVISLKVFSFVRQAASASLRPTLHLTIASKR
jgi:hypothetical protein